MDWNDPIPGGCYELETIGLITVERVAGLGSDVQVTYTQGDDVASISLPDFRRLAICLNVVNSHSVDVWINFEREKNDPKYRKEMFCWPVKLINKHYLNLPYLQEFGNILEPYPATLGISHDGSNDYDAWGDQHEILIHTYKQLGQHGTSILNWEKV